MAPAFAASLAVHAMLVLALVSWVAVGDRAQFPGRESLAVLLVGTSTPPSSQAPSTNFAIAAPAGETPRVAEPSAPVDARIAVPPSTASDAPAATAPPAAAPSANRVVSLGTVDVRLLADDMVTSLHPVHANRAGSEFPVEIAQGVRLAAKPDVKYPEDALAARRQGSVLAFVIVDAKGAVEEVSIVEGAPEFAQPVAGRAPGHALPSRRGPRHADPLLHDAPLRLRAEHAGRRSGGGAREAGRRLTGARRQLRRCRKLFRDA